MRESYLKRYFHYVGQKINELTILELLDKLDDSGRIMCRCQCSCGREKEFAVSRVLSGHNKSCGECDYASKSIYNACAIDLRGFVSGKLTALYPTDMRTNFGEVVWMCKCECGNNKLVRTSSIKNQTIKSCGMCGYKAEASKRALTKYHTPDEQRIMRIFWGMRDRCYNQNSYSYRNYGYRGIRICDEWLNNPSLFITWSLLNGYSSNLSIDRIDVNGNYCPENCRWITMREQALNKQNTVRLTFFDKNDNVLDQPLKLWCDYYGIPYMYTQLRRMSPEKQSEFLSKWVNMDFPSDHEPEMKDMLDGSFVPLAEFNSIYKDDVLLPQSVVNEHLPVWM